MLDKNDLQAIRAIMREELGNSENLVLREIDRVQENLEQKIEKLQKIWESESNITD